jgi:hypothetical protein
MPEAQSRSATALDDMAANGLEHEIAGAFSWLWA